MGSALIVGAGIVIASAVGPANEWRLAFHVRPDTSVVDRSQILRTESGVPGSVVLTQQPEVVRMRVPLSEQLIKKPVPPAPVTAPQSPKPRAVPDAPRRSQTGGMQGGIDPWMAIPAVESEAPRNTSLPGSETQIVNSGPTESAVPMRDSVTVTRGTDGWNKVEVTSGIGPNTAPKTMDVHDSQLHLFETAAQSQSRMSTAIQDMANGNASAMQALYRDIANAEAAANKTIPVVVRSTQRSRMFGNRGVGSTPGPIDPRLMEDEKAKAEAEKLSKLVGVDRYSELLARNQASAAAQYFDFYVRDNKEDGRAQAVFGLQQLAAKKHDSGLAHLAQACKFSASAWTAPLNLKELGISEAAVAESLGRLMARKEQTKGVAEAVGLAATAHAVGRPEAASRLLDVAVQQGMDPTEAANLAGLWKINK